MKSTLLGVVACSTLSMLLLSACGDQREMAQQNPEEAVRLRAQAWGDALINKDLEEAYSYTSPNYRQFATAGAYHARVAGAGNWDAVEVDTVECTEQVCTVKYQVEYRVDHMKVDVRRPIDYKWILVDGQWYMYVSAN